MGNGPERSFNDRPRDTYRPQNIVVQQGDEVHGFRLIDFRESPSSLVGVSVFTRGVAQDLSLSAGEQDLTKRRLAQTVKITKLSSRPPHNPFTDVVSDTKKFEPQYLITTENLLSTLGEMLEDPAGTREDPIEQLTRSYLQKTKKSDISDEEFEEGRTTVESRIQRAQKLWKKLFDCKVEQYAHEDNPQQRAWNEMVNAFGSITGTMVTRASDVGRKFFQSLLDEPTEVVKELDDYMNEDPSAEVLAIVSALREDAVRAAEEGKTGDDPSDLA